MKNRILVACVGVPIILVVLFVLPAPVTPALIAVLSAIGTYEALHAIGMNHPRISLYTAIIALAIPFWVYFGEPRRIGLLVLLIYLVAVFAEAFASHLRVKIDKVGAGFFFAFCHLLLPLLRGAGGGPGAADELYLPAHPAPLRGGCGRDDLRHVFREDQMVPHLSPKKTWEGSVGGLITGVVIAIVYGIVFHFITKVEVNYYFLAVYGHSGRRHHRGGRPGFFLCQSRNREDQGLRPHLPRVTVACWTASTA